MYRVALNGEGRKVKVEIWMNGYQCFVERDGEWHPDKDTDAQSLAWTGVSPILEKDEWPVGLSQIYDHITDVFEVPGGQWLAVKTPINPYFGIVQIMNSS